MRLVIDAQALQTPTSRNRGIGRYSRSLIRALAALHAPIELVVHAQLPAPDLGDLADLPVRPFHAPLEPSPAARRANEIFYGDWLSALAPDVILVPSPFEYEGLIPKFIGARPKLAAVLYDLIPLEFHDRYLPTSARQAGYGRHLRFVAGTDLLLAISQDSAAAAARLLAPDPPTVVAIGGAPDPSFKPLDAAELAEARARFDRFEIRREFILYVGGDDPRKNLDGAVEAFGLLPDELRSQLDLVIACDLDPSARRRVLALGRALGFADHLHVTGFIEDRLLRALYQSCRVFFFPSLHEGLGLPIVEAMRCGAPVVTSNCSAMPEVAGPDSWLADPYRPSDLARALREALATPRDRGETARIAHARKLDWASVARRALDALQHLVERGSADRPRAPRWRPRVAWISPLPPARSELALRSARLVEDLSPLFEIELVVPPGQYRVAPSLARAHALLTDVDLAQRHEARPFDVFVYHLGPGPESRFTLPLLARFPGLAILAEAEQAHGREAPGPPGAATADAPAPDDAADAAERAVLQDAEAIIVHEPRTWRRLRGATDGPLSCLPPVALPAAGALPTAPDRSAFGGSWPPYAAAIALAITRRRERDGAWTAEVVNALAQAGAAAEAEQIARSWAELRIRSRHPGAAASP